MGRKPKHTHKYAVFGCFWRKGWDPNWRRKCLWCSAFRGRGRVWVCHRVRAPPAGRRHGGGRPTGVISGGRHHYDRGALYGLAGELPGARPSRRSAADMHGSGGTAAHLKAVKELAVQKSATLCRALPGRRPAGMRACSGARLRADRRGPGRAARHSARRSACARMPGRCWSRCGAVGPGRPTSRSGHPRASRAAGCARSGGNSGSAWACCYAFPTVYVGCSVTGSREYAKIGDGILLALRSRARRGFSRGSIRRGAGRHRRPRGRRAPST